MPGPRLEGDEKESKQKKPRRVTIRDASFFLYKKGDNGDLSPIGSFETMPDILRGYRKALDDGVPQEQLVGHKTRVLRFKVREIERRVVAS